jgi:hypothetical protein
MILAGDLSPDPGSKTFSRELQSVSKINFLACSEQQVSDLQDRHWLQPFPQIDSEWTCPKPRTQPSHHELLQQHPMNPFDYQSKKTH